MILIWGPHAGAGSQTSEYFLHGSQPPCKGRMEGAISLKKSPVNDYEEWVKWKGQRVDTPNWWWELVGIPGSKWLWELAQKIRASFKLSLSNDQGSIMSRMTIWHLQSSSASAERNSYCLWIQCSPARISGRDSCGRFWHMCQPYSIGWRSLTPKCQANHTFWGGACLNWEGWWSHMWPSLMILSWMGFHSREVPGRSNWGNYSQEDPAGLYWGSHWRGAHHWVGPNQGFHWRGGSYRMQWRNRPHRDYHQRSGPTGEPIEEPTILMATISKPRCGMRRRERFPIVISLVGWRSCILPQPVTTAIGQTPPTLMVSQGEETTARLWGKESSTSKSRRACWQAVHAELDSTSPSGYPKPVPEIALPPWLKESYGLLAEGFLLAGPMWRHSWG